MRRRLAVPLIAILGIAPWVWFFPEPAPPNLPAALSSVVDIPEDQAWNGGLSGIEVASNGTSIFLISDRGYLWAGELIRRDGAIAGFESVKARKLVEPFVDERDFPNTDAEGLALDTAGVLYVSFEHMHRVLTYDSWDSPASKPSFTRAWRALSKNGGLEALAVDADGTLLAIPEHINRGASEALVYRRLPGEDWIQTFTIPVDPQFAPVGADFGPDGKFYLLERAIYPFGFYSRVRVMTIKRDAVGRIETVLQTKLGRHGNLEGLSVWQDPAGQIRLTMVSDDNYLPFMRGQIVEYILDDRVALPVD